MKRLQRAAVAVALGLLVLPAPARPAEPIVLQGVARVIDGDTLLLEGARIRLHGIDAPELRQHCEADDGTVWSCGRHAAAMLAAMTDAAELTCEGRRQDRYRRLVATCRAGGIDVGRRMVAEGMAVAHHRFGRAYAQAQDAARAAQLGVWAGDFAMPWDWRRARRRG